MTEPTTPDAGPNYAPPSLPPGYIAQWDNKSRKYYFVQISTGESTWDVPTSAAPQVPTPGGTPIPTMSDPFSKPGQGGEHGNGYGDNYGNSQGNHYQNNGPDDAQEGDRGFKVS